MTLANDRKALRGTAGTLCLTAATAALAALCSTDAPAVVAISTNATRNMSCSAGVCTATRASAILNVTDLQNMLAGGDLKITTGTGTLGGQVLDIVVAKPITWASSYHLTLEAYRSVTINQPVSATGTSALTLTSNAGGAGGVLTFGTQGYVTFWDTASSLTIDGHAYTLVSDIATLASDAAASPTGLFALAKSYDASVDGTYSSAPVSTLFGGAFEGLGNTISYLTISDSTDTNVGLFAKTTGGFLRDIGLSHASVTGTKVNACVGALVGCNAATIAGIHSTAGKVIGGKAGAIGGIVGGSTGPTGPISNSWASGAVRAKSGNIGGLVGASRDIDNSHSTGSVTATGAYGSGTNIGGLVGFAGNVTNSWSSSNITASDGVVGGLIGWANGGSVSRDYENGSIIANASSGVVAGGLIGENNGAAVDRSYAVGNISATAGGSGPGASIYAGGLVGFNGGGSSISNTYALGNVTGNPTGGNNPVAWVGGLIGEDDGNSLSTSYSTGVPSGTAGYTGGSVGNSSGGTYVYWDTTTSGTNNGVGYGPSSGILPISDSDLKSGVPAGFDGTNVWNWDGISNGGYPFLRR